MSPSCLGGRLPRMSVATKGRARCPVHGWRSQDGWKDHGGGPYCNAVIGKVAKGYYAGWPKLCGERVVPEQELGTPNSELSSVNREDRDAARPGGLREFVRQLWPPAWGALIFGIALGLAYGFFLS